MADSDGGITVFNVTAGQTPVAIAQVDTPGTAQAVACSGDLIAVADGEQGLLIVDASDPPAARIVRQVVPLALGGGSVQAVATAADLAIVGTSTGWVSIVEMNTGVVLDRDQIDPGGTVHDLFIAGETLYVYAGGELVTLSFLSGALETLGSAQSTGSPASGFRGRIFVGSADVNGKGVVHDVAYLTKSDGYNTFDVDDASDPIALQPDPATSQSRVWKQIVTNGSGLGVVPVGPFTPDPTTDHVSLFDTTDPTVTNLDATLDTTFPTPGIARAVSLFNGQAYVADNLNGLHVVNYKAFDTGNTAPNVPTGATGLAALIDGIPETGGDITEGKRFVLQAHVQDDVQLRNVEFFVNGERIVADGSFPFETAFRAPVGETGGTLSFTAVARDTGGNTLDLGPIEMTMVEDNKPPTVDIATPDDGDVFYTSRGHILRIL